MVPFSLLGHVKGTSALLILQKEKPGTENTNYKKETDYLDFVEYSARCNTNKKTQVNEITITINELHLPYSITTTTVSQLMANVNNEIDSHPSTQAICACLQCIHPPHTL